MALKVADSDAAAGLDAVVTNFANAFRVDEKVTGWLVAQGIHDSEDVASLAAEEKLVEPKIIDVLVAEGIESAKTPGQRVAITKLWRKCRGHMEENELKAKAQAKAVIQKAELPHGED